MNINRQKKENKVKLYKIKDIWIIKQIKAVKMIKIYWKLNLMNFFKIRLFQINDY